MSPFQQAAPGAGAIIAEADAACRARLACPTMDPTTPAQPSPITATAASTQPACCGVTAAATSSAPAAKVAAATRGARAELMARARKNARSAAPDLRAVASAKKKGASRDW